MADCRYHGYSGGPGICSYCRQEDEKKLPRGTIQDGYPAELAAEAVKGPDRHPDPLVRLPGRRT